MEPKEELQYEVLKKKEKVIVENALTLFVFNVFDDILPFISDLLKLIS